MQGSVLGASVGAVAKKTFDLSSQTDALALLNYVRGKAMDPELQNVTRNMILDYVFTPNQNLFTQITENLALIDTIEVFDSRNTDHTQTVIPKTEDLVSPRASFGSARPKPIFAQNLSTAPAADSMPDLKPATVKEGVVQTTDVPTSASEVDPVPAVPAPNSPVDHLGRIKEIKKLVNEKVGNPVNLIDANNEVGREYMNALLDAMKKVHGGEAAAVTSAMQRLEAAYSAVEETLKIAPLDTADPVEVAEPATEVVAEPVSGFAAQDKEVVEKVAASTVVASEATSAATETSAMPAPQNVASVAQSVAAEPIPAPTQPESVQTPEPVAPIPEVVPPTGGLQSLAVEDTAPASAGTQAEASIGTVEPDVQTVAPETTPAAPATADPLMDSKITSGLDQLLSEWSLFKSSGLFGTGPSGREHPMYMKLATLPMSSVVSGRFEGASAEVKQSLTDYMNGWRYEQGMVHEIEETFEHYLRRVIQAILAKQPKAE